jgi:hypothetical protein
MNEDDDLPCQPGISGRIWVMPEIREGRELAVRIVGDPEGLRSFGELLISLANADPETSRVPVGERDHTNLHPKADFGYSGALGAGSCEVEVCRADAAGTGEIYPHLAAAEAELSDFTADTTPPADWLNRAEAALELARLSSAGPHLRAEHVPALVAQSVFCSVMAGLRALGIAVPFAVDHRTQLTFFMPEGAEPPLEIWDIDDLLSAEMPLPGNHWIPLPTDVEIGAALEAGDKMLAWAATRIRAALALPQ